MPGVSRKIICEFSSLYIIFISSLVVWGLFEIIEIVETMLSKHISIQTPSLDEIFAIDEEVRQKTRELFI